jgi:hypothetical protein
VGAGVVGEVVEDAGVAAVYVEVASVLGDVVVGDGVIGARIAGAYVKGAGVVGFGVEGATVLLDVMVGDRVVRSRLFEQALREPVWRWLV